MSTLDESFQVVRPWLFGIAHRILKSPTDADDVVQDAWLRWHRTERSKVRGATTRVARDVVGSRARSRAGRGGRRWANSDPGISPRGVH